MKDKEQFINKLANEYNMTRGWLYTIKTVEKVIYLVLGVYIAKYIVYDECIFNEKCNPILLTFFCLLSLGCFVNLGLNLEKTANINILN